MPDPLIVAYVIASAVWIGLLLTDVVTLSTTDAYAYWALEVSTSGPALVGGTAFLYSPAAAQILAPFTFLPWPVFAGLYAALMLGALYAVSGRWAVLLLLAPPVAFELFAGNVHLFLAVVAVYGLRYPALWAFPLLTKVTPGIGLVWFAVRREWRNLGIALGATLAIVAVSFVLAPGAWGDWIGVLTQAQPEVGYPHVSVPVLYRLPFALLLVAWGAWTDRHWTVPLSMLLALPVIWPGSFALLVAMYPLRLSQRAMHALMEIAETGDLANPG